MSLKGALWVKQKALTGGAVNTPRFCPVVEIFGI